MPRPPGFAANRIPFSPWMGKVRGGGGAAENPVPYSLSWTSPYEKACIYLGRKTLPLRTGGVGGGHTEERVPYSISCTKPPGNPGSYCIVRRGVSCPEKGWDHRGIYGWLRTA